MGMMTRWRRASALAVLLVVLGVALAGCDSPAAISSAAVVDGQTISMSQYLALVRLLVEVNNAQNVAATSWQQPSGRHSLALTQQQALEVLVSNILFDRRARQINAAAKKTVIDFAQLSKQEAAQIKQTLDPTALPPSILALVNTGVLTTATYQPLAHQTIIGNAVLNQESIAIAHVRILTVKDPKTAADLRQQLLGGADWVQLAMKDSTDSAQQQGGDIPQLPPGILPAAVDQAIFATKSAPTDVQIVHTTQGYTLVRVLSVQSQPIKNLDTTVNVLPGSPTVSAAAVQSYLNALFQQANITVSVDWCGNITGASCGPINSTLT